MDLKAEIKNCLRLWIPPETEVILPDYQTASMAVNDFINGLLTPDDFLDILYGCNVDVDDYVKTVNLSFKGLINNV